MKSIRVGVDLAKRVFQVHGVLLNDTVHGHAPGSPPHIPRCLIPRFGKATPTGRIGPALPRMGGGPRPGYYYAGDLPDGE